ncbi:alpha-amylase family glycosyl hydrolase [Pelagicoccus mobilis]|uniref:Glycosyl hydrolase family 13 catalytic domain-containing protein n=1 Tax=Pelagicoccus mobilis TaxID=415221 RepID=A0A934S1B3_9BACT|nr:alpha-amylase family glycosyl hydrolase [Pelagicoccus mobilis]MBK1878776.1 hypothetical protein [Pelagicoccus mobilis]
MKYPLNRLQGTATLSLLAAIGCTTMQADEAALPDYYGTLEPWASEAIYFLLLDRFVDGDPTNNHEDQGGEYPTWDRKLIGPNGEEANVGYLGGDFKGVIDNLDYIKDMGMTAIWTTPIMDNPDEYFTGGEPIEYGGAFKDQGKTGYHGYWMTNFFVEDEHYVSPQLDLDFEAYADALHEKGFKVVFDIVANHGTPSFDMPADQPKFGELYDADWNLIADHQNLRPEDLDPENPMHAFFYNFDDILQLSNVNEENPAVMKYFVDAYQSWIDKGVDAFRIDTIRHVKHSFWKEFTDKIRTTHPGFYMFGESYVYDANFIAQHTLPKNGAVSVLDFPCREAMVEVFGVESSDENGDAIDQTYEELGDYLHLTHGPYHNSYDLVTFYENHDMIRIDATDEGLVDANNWLFTTRGIPCIYYGGEMAFQKGLAEHEGNRNYFGQDNVNTAKDHIVYKQLARIAFIRQELESLQRGLQINVDLGEDQASFYRVLQLDGKTETALVLLNKSDEPAEMEVSKFLQTGDWRNVESDEVQRIRTDGSLKATVAPHSFSIWVNDTPIRNTALIQKLQYAMQHK